MNTRSIENRGMSRPAIGDPVETVDTPALLVDVARLDANLERLHARYRRGVTQVRNVTKGHKCPAIAQLQMACDGSVPRGLACTKVSEAEVMFEAGARDIRMIEQVVGPAKIARLVALATQTRVIAVCDDLGQVRCLADGAAAGGVRLNVMIEVEIGLARCGVPPGPAALALARAVASNPHLRFAGLHAHEGAILDDSAAVRRSRATERLQRLVDCRTDLEEAGLEVEICGAGSTTTWDVAAEIDGITEVDPGSYALMDAKMIEAMPESGFVCALSLLATVISRPSPGRAVIDAGHKALGMATDGGLPTAIDPSLRVNRLNSEHGILDVLDPARGPEIGEKIELIPRYHGSTVVSHAQMVAVRSGTVAGLWEVAARGAHH